MYGLLDGMGVVRYSPAYVTTKSSLFPLQMAAWDQAGHAAKIRYPAEKIGTCIDPDYDPVEDPP